MFGRKKSEVEVAETEQVVERTSAELRAEHAEYCAEIDKRRHEVDLKERAKVRQEYMPGMWIRQAAFKARARQARADRHCRLPYRK